MNLIEMYIKSAGLHNGTACKIREIACKVAEFYRANENAKKPGISTAFAKRELITLNLSEETRIELARRLDKYAAMVSGAKCDGSMMTDAQRWIEFTPIKTVRI